MILVSIIIFASAFRFWDISAIGFGNDESIYSGQAAVLAGHDDYSRYFSIYRAHPLLLQFNISLLFNLFGVSDVAARAVPAIFGVLTILITYFIGKTLYNKKVGLVSALVLAFLPYHIIITRQALVDVPLSFFFILTLFFMARYVRGSQNNRLWVYLIGLSSGLSFISKEVGIVTLVMSILYMTLIRRLDIKNLVILGVSFLLATSPFWIPMIVIDDARNLTFTYLKWQSERLPNYPLDFYAGILSINALGVVLSGLCILSTIYAFMTKGFHKPSVLLLVWIAVPLLVFQLLPTKGFYFMVSLIPSFVILGISFLFGNWMSRIPNSSILRLVLVPIILLSTGPVISYFMTGEAHYQQNVAGSGGEPYMREAAVWIRDNTSQDSTFLTANIKMANIIEFYALRDAVSLKANQNPSYTTIENADLSILNGSINYLVYEKSLENSKGITKQAKELNSYITKFNPVPVHTEYSTYADRTGKVRTVPEIIIFSVK